MVVDDYFKKLLYLHLKISHIPIERVQVETVGDSTIIWVRKLSSIEHIRQAFLAIQVINGIFVDFKMPSFPFQTVTKNVKQDGQTVTVPDEVYFTIPTDQYNILKSKIFTALYSDKRKN